ncbi:MAG: flagellar export chaperone FliS [Vampirovibrionales bacterium]|nr:flagellar export chaperone FliS [Vampirovibrionales bacterium]
MTYSAAYSAMPGQPAQGLSQPYTVNQAANLAKQYKNNEITTASPEEVLILLYEGAIRFLKIAKKGIADKDIEKTHNNLVKTQRIITEFMLTLDMEVGGEIAENLYRLYEYLHYRLVHANLKKDPHAVDEVLKHLVSLKATWEQAIKNANQDKAAASSYRSGALPTPGEEAKRIQTHI